MPRDVVVASVIGVATVATIVALITAFIYCADVSQERLLGNRGKYNDTTSSTLEE